MLQTGVAQVRSPTRALAFTPKVQLLRRRLPNSRDCFSTISDLCFQLIHIEIRDSAVPEANIVDCDDMQTDALYTDMPSMEEQQSWKKRATGPCYAYVFGVTETGTSVCVVVPDFQPSFYMEHPSTRWSLQDSQKLNADNKLGSVDMFVVLKTRLFGWVPLNESSPLERKQTHFTRFFFSTPSAMRTAVKKIAEMNETVKKQTLWGNETKEFVISEHQVQPSQMLMQQQQLCPSGWVKLCVGTYTVAPLSNRATSVQLEINALAKYLLSDPRDDVARLLIAAVDIEAQSGDYRSFPNFNAASDVISYIGTSFYWTGDTTPCLRVMQVLGNVDRTKREAECHPESVLHSSVEIVVECYASEQDLLVAWRDLLVVRTDPDNVLSYNGTKFDFEYMFERYKRLHSSVRPARFLNMGRLLAELPPLKRRTLSSAAFGDNELSFFEMPGRYQLDLFMYVKNNYKLSSYKLDNVCKTFLKKNLMGKIVLDFPGWVLEETQAAWLNCGLPFLSLLQSCLQNAEALGDVTPSFTADAVIPDLTEFAHVVSLFERATLKATEITHDECVAVVPTTDVDATNADIMDAIGEEAEVVSKWHAVHSLLTMAKDALTKAVKKVDVNEAQRLQLANLLQMMTPALDASGGDNYRKLFRLYDRGPRERGQIVEYCQVDCDLLIYLTDALSIVQNMVKMSQVTFTLIDDIANRGQQIKVFNLIYRFASLRGFVVNVMDVGWATDAEYVGATVMDPLAGYYTTKIATLDFASLYPSIIRGHNLCYSSLVLDPRVLACRGQLEAAGGCFADYHLGGKDWVFQTHTPGILPMILEQLLNARKSKKREMKQHAKDSFAYRLCDAAQLALKVSCNSVYGFTGVLTNGMLSCMPIANATTSIGRGMIFQTKNFVEAQGYSVIYGDTDSVMVNTGHVTMAESFAIGKQLAVEATRLFPDTVQLEFEKVFSPYLLIKKKMYAGMKYEDSPELTPKLDVKGLAVVRRDNCKFLRDLLRDILYKVMRDNNPGGAYDVVRAGLAKLVTGNVPLSDLEISKSLRGEYKDVKQPHLTVVANMKARKEIDIPQMGDRVPFVILEKPLNCADDRIYLRAEHTKYVITEGLRIDRSYYLENQLKSHILRIMTPLPVPSVQRLFDDAAFVFLREQLGVRSICGYFTAESGVLRGGCNTANNGMNNNNSVGNNGSKKRATPAKGQKTLTGVIIMDKQRNKAQKRARSPERISRTFIEMFKK